jgi:hypothetical protein
MKHLIIFITLLAGNTWAQPQVQPNFTEPYTGKPVKIYEIELPVSRSDKQKFAIPAECAQVNSQLTQGAGRWGSRIERRMWLKVNDDCSYHAFLNNAGKPAEHDFVSQYDFFNADMSDLPLYPGCGLNLFLTNPAACPPKIPGLADFNQFVNRQLSEHDSSHRICKFQNGVFRGHIVHDGLGMHCLSTEHMPGFRILSVDFADVNSDNYQDAILRLMPIGPGNSPAPTILPLTRTSGDEKFSIPQNALFPTLGPADPRR